MNIREDFLRPRTDQENAARRTAILDAAEALLLESHNQRFSISSVAKRVGVSQSTIFLHFRNREDLLTSLYTRVGQNFFATFLSRLHEGMSDEAFSETFIDTALEFPAFRIMRPMIMRFVEESLNQAYIHEGIKDIYRFRVSAADQVEDLRSPVEERADAGARARVIDDPPTAKGEQRAYRPVCPDGS